MRLMYAVYNFLWADLLTIPLPNGGSLGLSLLVLMLVPAGIYFTIRSRFLQVRLFPEMLRMTLEKKASNDKNSLSGLQALIVSTAPRVRYRGDGCISRRICGDGSVPRKKPCRLWYLLRSDRHLRLL